MFKKVFEEVNEEMRFENTGSYYKSNVLVKLWRWRHKLYAVFGWLDIILFHRKDTLKANDLNEWDVWGLEMAMADARMGRMGIIYWDEEE